MRYIIKMRDTYTALTLEKQKGNEMTRKVFYSFHYAADAWRAGQVRNMGVVEGNEPTRDNDWETVVGGGDSAIQNWISNQMTGRTCAVVLVGEKTATRRWITYEIVEAWNRGMGVVGIYIHGLQNQHKLTSRQGENPLNLVTIGNRYVLSSIAKCYNPAGANSEQCYDWIRTHLSNAVEEAIRIRAGFASS